MGECMCRHGLILVVDVLQAACRSLKRVLLVAILALLGACKTIPIEDVSNGDAWMADAAIFTSAYNDRLQLQQWRYSAKVGVVTSASSEQANMIWEFNENALNTVRLYGPLGFGAVKIEFDDKRVVLSDRKGILHQGDNAQELLADVIGLSIPIDALHYWLFSLPLPSKAYDYKLDENKQLAVLRQLGWEIRYTHYRDYYQGKWSLARKVVATRRLRDGQEVVVTLVAKRWS